MCKSIDMKLLLDVRRKYLLLMMILVQVVMVQAEAEDILVLPVVVAAR